MRGEEVRGEDGSVCPDCIYLFILNVEADRTKYSKRIAVEICGTALFACSIKYGLQCSSLICNVINQMP